MPPGRQGRNREVSPINVAHVLAMHRKTLDEHARIIHELRLLVGRVDKNLRNYRKREKRDER